MWLEVWILEISWKLKLLLEILEISRNLVDAAGELYNHYHHFICPKIQQYAHLHEYNSRTAGQQGPI